MAHAITVVSPAMGDFNMPSNGEIRDRQEAVECEEPMLDTSLGMVVRHEDGPYQAEYGEHRCYGYPPKTTCCRRG